MMKRSTIWTYEKASCMRLAGGFFIIFVRFIIYHWEQASESMTSIRPFIVLIDVAWLPGC